MNGRCYRRSLLQLDAKTCISQPWSQRLITYIICTVKYWPGELNQWPWGTKLCPVTLVVFRTRWLARVFLHFDQTLHHRETIDSHLTVDDPLQVDCVPKSLGCRCKFVSILHISGRPNIVCVGLCLIINTAWCHISGMGVGTYLRGTACAVPLLEVGRR